MSAQAFDALLTCGVRDLTGLLALTVENLSQAGISSRITAELMGIQQQVREQTKSIQQNNGSGPDSATDETIHEEQQGSNSTQYISVPTVQQDSPIPNDLIKNISTRARNVLMRERILTCQRLLQFQETVLISLTDVGKKTLYEILNLQEKIVQLNPEFRQFFVKTAQSKEPKPDDRSIFSLRAPHSPPCREPRISDPAEWSVLSRILPEIFKATLPHCNSLIEDARFTINDLGIPPTDIDLLRGIALFPEDAAEVLFSVSVSYLLGSGIGDKTLSIILDHLARVCSLTDRSQITKNLSDIAIFSDIQTTLFGEFRVAAFLNSDITVTSNLLGACRKNDFQKST